MVKTKNWTKVLSVILCLAVLLGTILVVSSSYAASAAVTVKKASDGNWYAYRNGKVYTSYTGIAKNQYGWWRIVNGKVDFNANGVYQNENGWWKVENGKVNFDYTGIARNDYGWWRIVNGKVDFSACGVYKNEYGWWSVEKGKVEFGFTGLKPNQYGVWYVEKGKVRFNYTGNYDGNYIENSKYVRRVAEEPSAYVKGILNTMSLEDKVAQMCWVRSGQVGKYPVGGVILFASDLTSASQTKSLISGYQRKYSIGVFVSTDEEGGSITRVAKKLGTTKFSSMTDYATKGSGVAYSNAKTIGSDIAQFGFNVDFAPVADVAPTNNSAVEKRGYSRNYTVASTLVYSAVKGFKAGGVEPTLKHFPGLGSTKTDPHDGWAYINKTADKLRTSDYASFRSGIAAGTDFMMMGHVTDKAIDAKTPASLSYYFVTDVLRNELGYEGIIITDSLEMGAVTKNFGNADAAVRAVAAGNDMLLMPENLNTAISAVCKAVRNGTLSEADINTHVTRILMQKEAMGLL